MTRQAIGAVSLVEDTPIPAQSKRWVVVAPPGSDGCRLLLARAVGPEQASRVGNQTGGRVFLFLHTDDFWRDYEAYRKKGVEFSCARRRRRATARSPCSATPTATSGTCWSRGANPGSDGGRCRKASQASVEARARSEAQPSEERVGGLCPPGPR